MYHVTRSGGRVSFVERTGFIISTKDTVAINPSLHLHSEPQARPIDTTGLTRQSYVQLRWVIRRLFVLQVLVVPGRSFNGTTLSLPAILLSLQQLSLVEQEC
jgi:hypothetical protein